MAYPRIEVDEASELVVVAYCRYERIERRLEQVSVHNAAYRVRQFLAWRALSARPPLALLAPVEFTEFVVAESRRLSPGSMASTVTTLRNFARFLFRTGVTARDLSASVPTVARDRFGALPKALDGATVATLLSSCDRQRPVGRRDFAILTLMSRLGLRAVEVSRLELEDINWRAGEITACGKRGRRGVLPLSKDVGDALADYLRFGRRSSSSRAVFISAQGRGLGMSPHAVAQVSRNACVRLGIDPIGGHRLRHTLATNMLAGGAALREVAEVLRQCDAVTTAIYARVDAASLAMVMRSWPGKALS
jgi:site-specific recombinase XerD